VIGVRQGVLPALAGAFVVAAVELTATSAIFARPALSVTVNCNVNDAPPEGATTVTVFELAPDTIVPVPLATTQEYELMEYMQAAALLAALSTTCWPAVTPPLGGAMATIGCRAALTADSALAMPAPQVVVVQLHSASCE
jgi:hypothetical protein